MAATVRLSDIEMLGMFATKSEVAGGEAYEPIPYALGSICERCWLSPRSVWADFHPDGFDFSGAVDWSDYDIDFLHTVGHDGCPHGGGAS
jgi:hypothetical protein